MKKLTFTASSGKFFSEEVTADKSGRMCFQFEDMKQSYEIAVLASANNGKSYAPIAFRRITTAHLIEVDVMEGVKVKVRSTIKPECYAMP